MRTWRLLFTARNRGAIGKPSTFTRDVAALDAAGAWAALLAALSDEDWEIVAPLQAREMP